MERRKRIDDLLADYRLASAQVEDERNQFLELDTNLYAAQDAHKIIQTVSQAIQQEAHHRIASVVSKCLESIFDEPYTFDITFEQKRGRTEAILSFVRGDLHVDPMSASGGGVVDVASFALRLACLVLIRPPIRRLLVLDEPWKHLSEEYRPRMRELIETLSKEMGVQFVIITHSQEFKIGKVVEL